VVSCSGDVFAPAAVAGRRRVTTQRVTTTLAGHEALLRVADLGSRGRRAGLSQVTRNGLPTGEIKD
jgi:hypothetical protein